MAGHYNGRSRKGTMQRGRETHHITKWDFDPTSGEVDKNWIHSTDRATGTSKKIAVYERGNWMGNIKLSNGSYKYKV